MSKLLVLEIRSAYKERRWSCDAIARKFSIPIEWVEKVLRDRR